MLRKLSLVIVAIAALGVGGAAAQFGVPAQQQNKNAHTNSNVNANRTVNRNARVNRNANVNRNFRVNRNANVNRNTNLTRSVNRNFVVGHRYNGHIWYGRSRHFWHGTWYAYGDGPCWINVDGLWFWNELDCPI